MSALRGLLGGWLLGCGTALAAFTPPAKLVVVTDINFPPYLFQDADGRLQGILQDKWALWAERNAVAVRLEGMEWKKAQQALLEGSADVIEALAHTEARTRLYEYSRPYAPIEARVYFHQSIGGIRDVASMRGFTLGAKAASACGAWLRERGVQDVRDYATSEALVKAANAGEVRLFCMDTPAAQYYLYKLGLAAEFRQTEPLYTTQFHWAVKKGRTELRDFVERGFERVSAAELGEIDARWLGNPLRFPIAPRYLLYAAAAGAALLAAAALLVLWNRVLRSRVNAKTAELSTALQAVERHADAVRDLYDKAPCGYHSLDRDGKVVEINDTELGWLGLPRAQVLGRPFTEFLSAEGAASFGARFAAFTRLGTVHDVEIELRRADGSTMSVLLSASALRDAQGNFLMSRTTLHDVTDRKRAEDEVRRLNAELERRVSERTSELAQANQELEAFAYSVSHDLRAPLRSIDAFTQLALKAGNGASDPEAIAHLQRVRASSQRMAQLIDDLLALSNASRAALRRARVDVSAMAREIGAELAALEPGRQVAFSVAPEIEVEADESLLRIVLENLLRNAWKFTAHCQSAAIEVGVLQRAGATVYLVRDNGAGFDMRYADKLFGPFQRLHSEAEFSGTGIGLAIVARVVRRHGGEVWAEAAPDSGATFYFTLGTSRE